jgi:hypothetical protein
VSVGVVKKSDIKPLYLQALLKELFPSPIASNTFDFLFFIFIFIFFRSKFTLMQPDSGQGTGAPASWQADFEKDGFAIIQSAITPERAAYYRDQQLSWVEGFGLGFSRKNKKTWVKEAVPANFKEGIYSGHRVSHEKFMWEARLESGIIEPFSDLWKTTSLLVSFDGMNVTPPQAFRSKDQIPPWPHTDQHALDRDFLCAQGLLNTGPCGPRDGGLIVMGGSAALWSEFWESDVGKSKLAKLGGDAKVAAQRRTTKDELDLTQFTQTELAWYEQKGCKFRKLELKPGDFVIWDSRTIHYNVMPQGGELRTAIYICYAPAELATQEDLEKKTSLFHGYQGSTHWPHMNIRAVGKDPLGRKQPQKMHDQTEQLLQLAGVEPYR